MSSAGAWGIGSGSPTALFSISGGAWYGSVLFSIVRHEDDRLGQSQATRRKTIVLLPLNLCRKCFYTNPETILIYLES
jgi:hypothetical protein